MIQLNIFREHFQHFRFPENKVANWHWTTIKCQLKVVQVWQTHPHPIPFLILGHKHKEEKEQKWGARLRLTTYSLYLINGTGKLTWLCVTIFWPLPTLNNLWQPTEVDQQPFPHYLYQFRVYLISMHFIVLHFMKTSRVKTTFPYQNLGLWKSDNLSTECFDWGILCKIDWLYIQN